MGPTGMMLEMMMLQKLRTMWLVGIMMLIKEGRGLSTTTTAPSTMTRRGLVGATVAGLALPPPKAIAEPLPMKLTDELELNFEDAVGIELITTQYARTTLGAVPSQRIAVGRVVDGSAARALSVQPGWILVSANGQPLEQVSVQKAAKVIAEAERPLKLVFRDPDAFRDALLPGGQEQASTKILERYTNGEPQILQVQRLKVPEICGYGATRGDLLEVRYEGRLQDGKLFDGSAITKDGSSIPGRGGDSSLYFILGQQPVGQFPVAWDPAMTGACVGEIRNIVVPPSLGFQDTGSPRRGVPPYATVNYILELVSINGNYLPR